MTASRGPVSGSGQPGAWPRANGSRAVGWRGDWTVPDRRRLPRRLVRALPGQGGGRRARAGVGARLPGGARRAGLNVVWAGPDGASRPFTRMRPGEPGQDRWHAMIRPDAVGSWTFTVEAFEDPYLTWRNAVTKKIAAGQGPEDLANDLAEGARVLAAAQIVPPPTGTGSRTRPPPCGTPSCRCRAGRPRAGAGGTALAAPGPRAGHHR